MTDVVMPQMGESIVEGTLTKWLKKPGEHVERDEPLFEISTDKVDTEIPAPVAGSIRWWGASTKRAAMARAHRVRHSRARLLRRLPQSHPSARRPLRQLKRRHHRHQLQRPMRMLLRKGRSSE